MEREKACDKTDDQCLSNFMAISPDKLVFYCLLVDLIIPELLEKMALETTEVINW